MSTIPATGESSCTSKRKQSGEEEDTVVEKPTARPRRRAKKNNNDPVNPFVEEYDLEEMRFYKNLSYDDKKHVIEAEQNVHKLNDCIIPVRFRILLSEIDERTKAIAVKKLGYLANMEESSSEYYKILNWIHSVCQLPINKYKNLPVRFDSPVDEIKSFILNVRSRLDQVVYGHKDAKEQIIRLLAQWVSNPEAKGMVIGIQGPMGCGKCHAADTPILMYDGSIKRVQDIQVGDVVMGDDSTPRTVLALGNGEDDMYDIVDQVGERYRVNSEHILCLKKNDGTPVEMTVKDFLTLPKHFQNDHYYGYRVPVDFHCTTEQRLLEQEPYQLGWALMSGLPRRDTSIKKKVARERNKPLLENMTAPQENESLPPPPRRIPHAFKTGSRATRMQVLAGILDAGGCLHARTWYTLPYVTDACAQDVLFVARSLGFSAYVKYTKRAGRRVAISGRGLCDLPMRLLQKKASNKKQKKDPLLSRLKVKPVGRGRYYGFTLDENHKYVLGNFVVTHNTTLIKDGICQVLGLPFAFIPLGGASDGSYLDGHSYTYEGSTWGKIVDVLMRCKCMNPVFFFDELDKISTTHRGEEIANILIHLTDSSQNDAFHDKYFTDFDFDLSKSLMIFSYNDEDSVNPILKDRMIRIHTSGYSTQDKLPIAKQYMFPLILKEYNFNDEHILLSEEVIRNIIELVEDEKGVRNLKRALQNIVSHLNLNRILDVNWMNEKLPYTITSDDVRSYVNNKKKHTTLPFMYT